MRTVLRQCLSLLAGLAQTTKVVTTLGALAETTRVATTLGALVVTTSVVLLAGLAGCRPAPQPTPAPTPEPTSTLSLTDKAAAEATAIVQRAQATALVLRANATAAALTQLQPAETSAAPAATRAPQPSPAVTAAAVSTAVQAEETAEEQAEVEEAAGAVVVVGVGFAADTGFIAVTFKAPKKISDTWSQGTVYVVDEATGDVYDDIPMMPILGPLLARPPRADQLGYVMFQNAGGRGIHSGDLVTVVLGDFKQEHVKVM